MVIIYLTDRAGGNVCASGTLRGPVVSGAGIRKGEPKEAEKARSEWAGLNPSPFAGLGLDSLFHWLRAFSTKTVSEQRRRVCVVAHIGLVPGLSKGFPILTLNPLVVGQIYNHQRLCRQHVSLVRRLKATRDCRRRVLKNGLRVTQTAWSGCVGKPVRRG